MRTAGFVIMIDKVTEMIKNILCLMTHKPKLRKKDKVQHPN